MIVGEFETMTTCKCGEEVFISEIIMNSDGNGNGFYKEISEECGYCTNKITGELRLDPEFDFY